MKRRGLAGLLLAAPALAQSPLRPLAFDAPDAVPLLGRMRAGGVTLFFRHAATGGEPCDRTFRVGDRAGQRNLSALGRAQAVAIGERLRDLRVPLEWPLLAGPVFRARDTAELAFGTERVRVTDALLADDYAGDRVGWVLEQHRQFFAAAVPGGVTRVLVGHRTPAIMVLGEALVGGRALPEGGALVIGPGAEVLGIVELAPTAEGGWHSC